MSGSRIAMHDAAAGGRHRRATPRGPIRFRFEGRPLAAREGYTVAAALIANGVRVFGRSSKYHRPRGYRCGQGHCSACAMRVDGMPGVRTCVTKVRPGMTVEREHAFPNAGVDVLRAAEIFSPLIPPGFYYRWFRHSPRLWGALERGLAHVAGQGGLPSREAVARLGAARCARRAADVLVVGGGVAGMSAALAAAEAGASVLLVERDDRLGGRLDDVPEGLGGTATGPAPGGGAASIAQETALRASVDVLLEAEAVAWYDEGIVAIDHRSDLLLVHPAAVVLATGGYDRGLPFPGWDLPGVMTATGALRLWERHGVAPGGRAVVVTTGDLGYDAARRLAAAGVEIAAVADCRQAPAIRKGLRDDVVRIGATLLTQATGARAHGSRRIRALSLSHGSPPDCSPHALGGQCGRSSRVACDLVVISASVRPADDLAYQARARGSLVLAIDEGVVPRDEPAAGTAGAAAAPGLWLAGLVAGTTTADAARTHGTEAGMAAARLAHAVRGRA